MRSDPRHTLGTLRGMILTEYGLHFRRDRWRCVEHRAVVMLRGGGYEVGEYAALRRLVSLRREMGG